ncbi:hypothetical protein E3P92_04134 [Wallemia ichthyophaga]|uniref:Sugar phosphate phosphatase n=2 Tax=Wallemia ichthyophaga TaxID=245174 RepID=A0A4T0G5Z3_WALIC|nr:UPF0364 protein C.04c [Wallemia ichthyophaga EXF-994]TIA68150.1 hypothetical protein E3P91_04162 [Wallemia ichthyophaga]EOR02802.1 UPF0364 protein C.04c [Wallemia ichthyophaga EXF-994]TIA77580.1 hypothetical protein E3P98_04132 [Wallemia ichthyophaga]TIA91547.1 hypothetical protein E3P97_02024 [Wallemia ichthyophaga]TIA94663.1 hypothetical protein E3P95_04139 [Wallemia ichthyophaga]
MAQPQTPNGSVDIPNASVPSSVQLRLKNMPPRSRSYMAEPNKIDAKYVNPESPPFPAFRGYHTFSFANDVMGRRLPTILGKAIEDTIITLNGLSKEDEILDLLSCIERMDTLMDDLKSNKKLTPIPDDGSGDIAIWNKEIAKYFQGKDFMSAPWIFAEAYKYRRLHSCFSFSKYFQDYDVFFRQKCDTFARSSHAVFELATRFAEPFHIPNDDAKKLIFMELFQVCLWGNSTDLSLLIDMTEEDIKNLQSTGGDQLAATQKNILGNDIERVWNQLKNNKNGRIDFVLDNAGFELFTDLVLADFLIQAGLADQVKFHGKRFAWFVSDVTKKDWEWLINSACYGRLFKGTAEELNSLRALGNRWKRYEQQGKIIYEQHPFWISGYTFYHLLEVSPDLFLDLHQSKLVFFKGDLNHRKLTYDCRAPPTTPFSEAIGTLASAPGAPPVCSMRTIKSDVVVGLPPGVAEKLDKEEKDWRLSGRYSVILMSDGRPNEDVDYEYTP